MAAHRLLTLGRLELITKPAGAPIAALQKQKLLMLVVIASAGQAGIAREKLAEMFWPDHDDARSRNALNQALFNLRRGVQEEQLVEGIEVLRLRPGTCHVDFVDFEAAATALEWETALSLYGGAFLDGVRLGSSVPLERWVDDRRASLEDMFVSALRGSGRAARMRGEVHIAVDRARQHASLRPADASAASELVRILRLAGDTDAARRHVALYARITTEGMGVVPDPLVAAALEEELVVVPAVPPAVAGSEPPRGDALEERSPPMAARRTMRVSTGLAVIAAFGIAVAAVVAARRATVLKNAQFAAAGETVAIFPFCVRGASIDSSLADGIVDVVYAGIPGDAGPRPLDPRVTMNLAGGAGAPCVLTDAQTRALARRLDASFVVTGTVVRSMTKLVITASIQRVREATVPARAVVTRGSVDSLPRVLSDLTARVHAVLANEPDSHVPDILTRSAPALRSYLHGRALWRSGQMDAALAELVAALDADSTFALAGAALVEARGWTWGGQYEVAKRHLIRVSALRGRLSRRDEALLDAGIGSPPHDLSSVEALVNWHRAVDLASDSPVAWYEYGDRLFHTGAATGRPNARADARVAFEKALALDSSYAPPVAHLVEEAALRGDTASLLRYASIYAVVGAKADVQQYIEWRIANFLGDRQRLDRVHSQLADMTIGSLTRIAGSTEVDGIDRSFGLKALMELRRKAQTQYGQYDAAIRLHDWAVNQRAWALADSTISTLSIDPSLISSLKDIVSRDALRLTDVIFGNADSSAIGPVITRLLRTSASTAPTSEDHARYLGENCVLGLWFATRDSARMQVVLRRVKGVAPARVGMALDRVTVVPALCEAMIEAEFAVAYRPRTAMPAVERLDSLAAIGLPTYGSGFANFETARLFARLGAWSWAKRAVARRIYDWNESIRYLRASRELEAELVKR